MKLFYQAMQVQVRLGSNTENNSEIKIRITHSGVTISDTVNHSEGFQTSTKHNFWLYDHKNVIVCVMVLMMIIY